MRRTSGARVHLAIGAALAAVCAISLGAVQPAMAADPEPAEIVTPRVMQHLTPVVVLERGEISWAETYACPQQTHPYLVAEDLSLGYPLPPGVEEITSGKWMEMVPSADRLVAPDGRVIGITNAKFQNSSSGAFEGYFVLHCTWDISWSYKAW